MKTWDKLRTVVLLVALLAGGGAIARVGLFGVRQSVRFPAYDLPDQVAIADWQFRQSHLTTAHTQRGPALVSSVDDQAIAARRYQYLRNGKPLDVEVRYFVRTYRHVPSLIEDSTLLSTKPALRDRRHPKLGSYVLYPQQGNLHLSACLDPYGKTSVYDNEVMLHQARPEVVSQRLLPWILGQAPLRDLRCLWVDLSMPIAPGRFEVDRVDATPLEAAFGDWVEWWSQNYPTEPPT